MHYIYSAFFGVLKFAKKMHDENNLKLRTRAFRDSSRWEASAKICETSDNIWTVRRKKGTRI